MGDLSRQFKSEMKLLPYMIGKLLGGIAAVIGFTAAVVIVTRRAAPSFADILPSVLSGCMGVVLFVFSSGRLTRRLAENPAENAFPGNRTRTSMLSWAILLLLAVVFLLLTYCISGSEDRIPRSPSDDNRLPDRVPIKSPGFPGELSGKCLTTQDCLEYCKSHPSDNGCERLIDKSAAPMVTAPGR